MCGEVGLTTVTGLLLVTWSADGWQVSSAHPTDPGDPAGQQSPHTDCTGHTVKLPSHLQTYIVTLYWGHNIDTNTLIVLTGILIKDKRAPFGQLRLAMSEVFMVSLKDLAQTEVTPVKVKGGLKVCLHCFTKNNSHRTLDL